MGELSHGDMVRVVGGNPRSVDCDCVCGIAAHVLENEVYRDEIG